MKTFQTYYPQEINAVVKQITVIQETDPALKLNTIPYFADGLPGIYFQQSTHDVLLNNGERRLSKLFLYGQTVKPITIDTTGPYTVIILQLYPPAIRTLFGIDAFELTDTCVDYEYLTYQKGYDLKNRLLDEGNVERKVNFLKEELRELLRDTEAPTRTDIYHATQRIVDSGGLISLRGLQDELSISERTFQRQFLQHVGISPSQFKGIVRFRMALKSLEKSSEGLSQIAYQHGYSDLSHFIRIFKLYTGKTPTAYVTAFLNGIRRNNRTS